MKKFVTTLLASALALGLSLGVSAAEGEVLKMGTAKIDAELDEAYKYSLCIAGIGTDALEDCSVMPEWNYSCSADAYFMYDEENLYICAVVTDDDVLTKGEAYAKSENPWKNDVLEFKLSLDGTNDVIKVSVDAYGYNLYGLKKHYDIIDYSTIKYATKITDTGYIIEISVPCTKGKLDMIAAGKVGIQWQLNDLNAEGVNTLAYNFYTAYPAANGKVAPPVFYNLSSEKAEPAGEAAPDNNTQVTVPSEGSTAQTGNTQVTAPATFDPAFIAVVLTAVSGAAFVVTSKKR